MKFIKKFDTHSDYTSFIATDEYVKPNFSYCENEDDVHYKSTLESEYLTFIALENGTFSFSLNNLDYSLDDGETWTTLTTGNSTPTVNEGDTIMWKATGLTPVSSNGIGTFSSTGKFNVRGNIMSLYYGDEFEGETSVAGKDFAFAKLFSGNTNIVSAEKLVLPTTLSASCFRNMFRACSSLVNAPKLPAMTMTNYCYGFMFASCNSLTKAPKLPATSLAPNCYQTMFFSCVNLTIVPELPATVIPASGYTAMFNGCTALKVAPELPATTLAERCYYQMFGDCVSLVNAPELPATTLAERCYYQMFFNCSNLKTATSVLPSTIAPPFSYTSMFAGCTNIVTAPKISATTLQDGSCFAMFSGCTNLIEMPDINITSIGSGSCLCMFSKCRSITVAKDLPLTTLNEECYRNMFESCSNLIKAPSILPATTLVKRCYDGMFWNCTKLKKLPELPATTLAEYCYWGTFRATAVEESPVLSAQTLVAGCYNHLFMECPNLKKVTCLATDISASACTEDWITGVGQDGTFIKAPSMTGWTLNSTSGIPSGWTVEDAENSDPFNGHDYVDLGLPSGTLWATMNVGANSITGYGDYYQYGRGADTYQVTSGNSVYDGPSPLVSSADTATQVWGGAWHTPTSAQLDELVTETDYDWVTNYQGSGINGELFTKNGQSLFIPASGYYNNGSISNVGGGGYIWGSTQSNSTTAYHIFFDDSFGGNGYSNKQYGYPIRGVVDATQ